MSKSFDVSTLSAKHLDSIEMDLVKREFSRSNDRATDRMTEYAMEPAPELASLREFNAQLLERIGDFRNRNLELSTSENTLRLALAAQERARADREAELKESLREIASLREAIHEQAKAHEGSRDEWNRKLARLTDDQWAKDLEIENQRAREKTQAEEIEYLKNSVNAGLDREMAIQAEITERRSIAEQATAELAGVREERDRLAAENERLRATELEQAQRLDEAGQLMTDLESELEVSKAALEAAHASAQAALAAAADEQARSTEAFRAREAQLIGAFDSLRAEYSSIDKCYQESMATVTQLRNALRDTEIGAEKALSDLQANLHEDFQKQFEVVAAENKRLREMLDVRDGHLDAERVKLQTWQEQLNFLDQHLRQFATSIKKDKADVLRIAQQVAQELEIARQHPFHEYLEATEQELVQLQTQLQNTSALSPQRTKVEVRLAQTNEHRDLLKHLFAESQRHLTERAQLVESMIKHANSFL